MAHHDDWHAIKAVDFLVKLPDYTPETVDLGVLSRDAKGRDCAGHLSILLETSVAESGEETLHLVVRLQEKYSSASGGGWGESCAEGSNDADNEAGVYHLCSEDLTPRAGEWVHVGINLGDGDIGSGMFIDGAHAGTLSLRPANDIFQGGEIYCNLEHSRLSLAGNMNSWLIGGSSHSYDGGPRVPELPFVGGAIDELRFHSACQDYEDQCNGP